MRISDWSSDVCSSDLTYSDVCLGLPFANIGICLPKLSIVQCDDVCGYDCRCELVLEYYSSNFNTLERILAERVGFEPTVRLHAQRFRSEERRVGKEGVITVSSRWSAYN